MTISRRGALRAVTGAVLVGLAVVVPSTAQADGDPSARIDDVQVSPGHASFVLTTANVSDRPESTTVNVDADHTALPARVTPVGKATATAAPPRAVIVMVDTSGSMAGSGIAAARQAALSYLADLPS